MRKLKAPVVTFLLATAFMLLPGRALAGDPKWVRITSENFVVYSDAGEKRAREVVVTLESFRALLVKLFPSAVAASHNDQLPVVAFKNDGAFTPFKPLYNGKPANLSGVFLRGQGRSMVALDASSWQGTSHVIFHEYIHRLLAGSDVPIPVWFNEGLAEFYSTATTEGKKATVGRAIGSHMQLLRERGMMPLDQLFAVTHDSPEYNERQKQGIFYAESWAFVHYLILNQDLQRPKQLQRFAIATGRGASPETAFREAFGVEPAAIEKEIRKYISGVTMPMATIDFSVSRDEIDAKVEPAPVVEVEYQLGNLLAFSRRFEEAEAQYRKAAAADSASALPHEGLGLVALFRQDGDAAKAAFGEAVKRDSKSVTALYYYAQALADEASDASRTSARTALERAIAIDPSYARAYGLMARLARREGDYPKAVAMGERGLALAPDNTHIRLEYALALVESGKTDEGRAQLERIADNGDDEGLRAFARNAIEQIDLAAASRAAVARAPEAYASSEESASGDPGPPRLTRNRPEPAAAAEEVSSFTPANGELSVRGVLKRLVCDDKTMTALLDIGNGRVIRITSTDLYNVSFTTAGLAGSETITCDEPLDREAIVHFRATPSGALGEMTAIVFTTLPK